MMAAGRRSTKRSSIAAISSPLLETSIKGAKGVVISISAAPDVGLEDIELASSMITNECNEEANVIWGVAFDPELQDELRITIISTGFTKESNEAAEKAEAEKKAIEEKEAQAEAVEADAPVAEAPKKKSVTGFDVDDFFN